MTPRQVPPGLDGADKGLAAFVDVSLRPAIADYDEAICLRPEYGFAFYNRGSAWEEKEDISRAIADHNEALRIDSSDILAAEALKRWGHKPSHPRRYHHD